MKLALTLAALLGSDLLVSTQWLERNLDRVTVVHAGTRAEYDAAHIPGAVFVDAASLVVQRDPTPNELPPVDQLVEVFRSAGLGTRERIVVSAVDPVVAARAWFTLDYLGQRHRTVLLDGGLPKWIADRCATSQEPATPKRGTFEASPVPQKLVHRATVRKLLDLPGVVLIDARPPAQFATHIPGAVNLPVAAHFADGVLRSPEELRVLYESIGVTKETANITYCRTGMQAAVPYFVLAWLGYDAMLYDGSFIEWTNAGERVAP